MRYGQYGNWYANHNVDSSLRPESLSRNDPIVNTDNEAIGLRREQRLTVAVNAETAAAEPAARHDNAFAFYMACGVSAFAHRAVLPSTCNRSGHMLLIGGPDSDIGSSDLFENRKTLIVEWCGDLESLPAVFPQCTYWKYGTGEHHKEERAVLGSVVLFAYACDETQLLIFHLVLDGTSQWVIGSNGRRRDPTFDKVESPAFAQSARLVFHCT